MANHTDVTRMLGQDKMGGTARPVSRAVPRGPVAQRMSSRVEAVGCGFESRQGLSSSSAAERTFGVRTTDDSTKTAV